VEKHKSDIFAAAHLMHGRFGERALAEVRLRIAELTDHGEHQAASFWQEVEQAIAALQDKGSRGPRH